MGMRLNSPVQLVVFWPLVLLALILRLTFGGMAAPSSMLVDQIGDLAKLAILCDDSTATPAQDGHHHGVASLDDSLLLSDALELFLPVMGHGPVIGRLLCDIAQRVWVFAPIRGPPRPERTALCPQGPPC